MKRLAKIGYPDEAARKEIKFWLDAAGLVCASHHFNQLNYFMTEEMPLSQCLPGKIFTNQC